MSPFPALRLAGTIAAVVLVAAVFLVAGCAHSPTPEPEGTIADAPRAIPETRTDAGGLLDAATLLNRPDLQRLVERQARRDTAALVAALADADAAVRARAALGLGSIQAASAVPALLALLADADPGVRQLAAFAVGQSADAEVTGALLDALRGESDVGVRREVLHALGKTGDRSALAGVVSTPLPAALDADRALAISRFGLRGVHDPSAVAWLAHRLQAPDSLLRRNAAYYFGRLRESAPWQDHEASVRTASAALAADDPAQLHLAQALGRLADAEAELVRLLQTSGDWRVRTNAARALGARAALPDTLGGPHADAASGAARSALLEALYADASPHVAIAAAEALAGFASTNQALDAATLDALATASFAHPMVIAATVSVLARHGRAEDAVRRVREWSPPAGADAARSALPYARAAAVRALEPLEARAAFSLLADAATDADARVATAAVEALRARWQRERSAQRAPVYYGVFTEALRRADLGTAYAAAPALADSLFFALGAGDVLREVYASMIVPRDVEPMAAILAAQGAERDTAAVTFLLGAALEAPHPVLRRAATDALDARFGEGIDFEPTGGAPPPFPTLDWERLRGLGPAPELVLETDRGTVVLRLAPDLAPLTVQAITRLAENGQYDGVPFHRVVPNFVVQGGDFERGDGFGGPGFFLPSEFAPLPYEAGVLGMASAGKDTEGSQFFITHSMQPHLDGRYTAFGLVIQGQDVVDALQVGDRIRRATVRSAVR